MSSHKTTATNPARRSKATAPIAAKSKLAAAAPATDLAATASQLAADIKRSLAAGQIDALPPEAVQALMTAACRLYAAQVEAGQQYSPVGEVSSTDIMVTASGLLKAGNLAVFELGMWQSWTGR